MSSNTIKSQRNYYLDFLKFIFTIFVFLNHSMNGFLNENTTIPFEISSTSLGYVSVHAFFTISGLLMINSISRKEIEKQHAGQNSLLFVIHKYKAIALPYITALLINTVIYYVANGAETSNEKLPFLFLEVFALMQGGTNIGMVHNHNWYISAMLVAMLPLSYILFRNKDFYINVFCPIAALTAMGIMYQSEFANSNHYLGQYVYCGIVMGGVIRAICGLCCGGVAWLISNKLKESVKTRNQRIVLTVIELFLYFSFFAIWFHVGKVVQYNTVSMMLLPAIIAIAFSGKSYTAELFKSKIFSKLGSLSLAIYLTHWSSEILLMEFMPDESYKFSLLLMVLITAVACVLYYTLMALAKLIWNKGLKKILT